MKGNKGVFSPPLHCIDSFTHIIDLRYKNLSFNFRPTPDQPTTFIPTGSLFADGGSHHG